MADPDSMSAAVGGCEGDSESRVHSRFLLFINGLEMKPGLGGRFPTMMYVVLFVVIVEFPLNQDWPSIAIL